MFIQVILNLNREEKRLGNKFTDIFKNLNSVKCAYVINGSSHMNIFSPKLKSMLFKIFLFLCCRFRTISNTDFFNTNTLNFIFPVNQVYYTGITQLSLDMPDLFDAHNMLYVHCTIID